MIFGYVFTSDGIYPDPEKVGALNEMKPPANPSVARIILGMLIYVAKFLPGLTYFEVKWETIIYVDVRSSDLGHNVRTMEKYG